MEVIKLSQINEDLENEPQGGQRYSMKFSMFHGIHAIENCMGKWRKHTEVVELENALIESDNNLYRQKKENEEMREKILFLEKTIDEITTKKQKTKKLNKKLKK